MTDSLFCVHGKHNITAQQFCTDCDYATTRGTIYKAVLEAMQDAEEIWGLGDDLPGYLGLMSDIVAECQQRMKTAKKKEERDDARRMIKFIHDGLERLY